MFSLTDSSGKPLERCLQRGARAQRTALRDLADQGYVGDDPGSFAERRVRRLRTVELHAVRRCGAADAPRRQLRAARAARRAPAVVPGRGKSVQVRLHRRLGHAQRGSLERRVQLHAASSASNPMPSTAWTDSLASRLARSSRFASSVPAAWPASGRRKTRANRSTTRWRARRRSARPAPTSRCDSSVGGISATRTSRGANSCRPGTPAACRWAAIFAAAAKGKAPSFMVWAIKDPLSGNLDRIQIVKGWVDAGGAEHEKIYDVAWSGNRKPDAKGKLPAVGNTVDAEDGLPTRTRSDRPSCPRSGRTRSSTRP